MTDSEHPLARRTLIKALGIGVAAAAASAMIGSIAEPSPKLDFIALIMLRAPGPAGH